VLRLYRLPARRVDTVLKTNIPRITRPPNTATVIIAVSVVEIILMKILSRVLKNEDITLNKFFRFFIVIPP